MSDDIGHLVLNPEIKEEWIEDDNVERPNLDDDCKGHMDTDVCGGADPCCDAIQFVDTSLLQVKEEPLTDVVTDTSLTLPLTSVNDPTWDGSSSEYSSNDDDFCNDECISTSKRSTAKSRTGGTSTASGGKKNSRTKRKSLNCDICDFVCGLDSDLRRHMRIHTGEKPFKCEVCDSRFTQACHVKVHMRTHTGEKKFACDACGFTCNRASNLKTHKIRAHTGLKPFSCEVCGQRFKLRGDLDRHVLVHTGEKPFPCDICDSKFTQAGHLRAHKRTHTGEKPYACQHCDYKCTRTKTLKSHMRRFHSHGVS